MPKYFFLFFCYTMLGFTAFAGDTISFVWERNADRNFFDIEATAGKSFKVDWGDGTTTKHTGNFYENNGGLEGIKSSEEITEHVYIKNGSYTVTIAATDTDCFFFSLNANYKSISTLDISKANALTSLNCSGNELANIDVSKNSALTSLDCSNNKLTSLDIFNNKALTQLNCSKNQLSGLNLCKNTKLKILNFENNKLTSLNLNSNTSLTELNCNNNILPLTHLKVASKKISDPEKKSLGTQTFPTAEIPLNTSLWIDSAFNGVATTLKVNKLGGAALKGTDYTFSKGRISFKINGVYTVEMSNADISSNLKFPAKIIAGYLAGTISKQQISFIWESKSSDMSFEISATVLKPFTVNWGDGIITNHNGNGKTAWKSLSLYHKYNIDSTYTVNISGVTDDCFFTHFVVCNQSVSSVNVSKATALEGLICYGNQLSALDISKNSALDFLRCEDNQLTELDVSNNISLTSLGCGKNLLTALNVNKNKKIEILNCFSNQLTALDLYNNKALKELVVNENRLRNLDVSNNTALTYLNCMKNRLTLLDISKNIALKNLDCSSNQLKTLVVSKNTNLKKIDCSSNQLTALDLSSNNDLSDLDCSFNQLKFLDINKNKVLNNLKCSSNHLTTLDAFNNFALQVLYCSSNQLTTLLAGRLTDLVCSDNAIPLPNLKLLTQLNPIQAYTYMNTLIKSTIYFGTQMLPPVNVKLNNPIIVDKIFNGINTVFTIKKSGTNAILDTDYILSGGTITFKTEGKYIVEITNPHIITSDRDPVKIIAHFVCE